MTVIIQKPAPPAAEEPAGQDLPSTFINRFNITLGPVTTRIVFGEAVVGTKTNFHSAQVMMTTDALELAQLILRLHEQNQKLGPSKH